MHIVVEFKIHPKTKPTGGVGTEKEKMDGSVLLTSFYSPHESSHFSVHLKCSRNKTL